MVKLKKSQNKILAVLLVIALIGLLAFFIIPQKQIDVGVDDQGVSLKVFARSSADDKVGQELEVLSTSGKLFSTIEFSPPGTPVEGITQIRIEHTISNTISDSNIDVLDLIGGLTNPIGGVIDARYDNALTTDPITALPVEKSFTLAPLAAKVQSSAWFNIDDLDSICNTAGTETYCTLRLTANYAGVDPDTGVQTALSTFGTRNLKISGDVCSDGTPWGQCSLTSPKGKFCDNAVGLIDCADPTGCTPVNYIATSCGCETGYYEDNGDAVCTPPTCGSTTAGECTGTDSILCDPNCTTEACTSAVDCTQCGQAGQTQGQPLGSGFASCSVDYYSNPAQSCNGGTGLCVYRDYSGSISVNLAGQN